jgi:hypothetical protein
MLNSKMGRERGQARSDQTTFLSMASAVQKELFSQAAPD